MAKDRNDRDRRRGLGIGKMLGNELKDTVETVEEREGSTVTVEHKIDTENVDLGGMVGNASVVLGGLYAGALSFFGLVVVFGVLTSASATVQVAAAMTITLLLGLVVGAATLREADDAGEATQEKVTEPGERETGETTQERVTGPDHR